MELNFNNVSYDGDLDDVEREDLLDLISQYEDAQEANTAEFEAAKETIEEVEDVDVEDFHDARSDLVEAITEYDAFEASPLVDEDDLDEASFGKLREYEAYFAEQEADGDSEETEDGGSEFDDMGKQSPEDTEQDDAEFAEQYVGEVAGVNF